MPTRKQVRRERKRRVHGIQRQDPARAPRVERTAAPRKERPRARGARPRGVRPASFRRSVRRLPVIALFVFLAMYALNQLATDSKHRLSFEWLVGQAVLLTLVMTPVMHLVDILVYRTAVKKGQPLADE